MKVDKEMIIQLINLKNKNRKNEYFNRKNIYKNINLHQKNISTTHIDVDIKQICKRNIDIYPQNKINDNKSLLVELSKYLTHKINSNIVCYRSIKNNTIVQFIAKDSAIECLKHKTLFIEDYIDQTYDIELLYKKELMVLPYLLLVNYLSILVQISDKLDKISQEILDGSIVKNFKNSDKFSDAKIYGLFKYNEKMLKIGQISNLNYKKCVFRLFKQLNKYNGMIEYLFKAMNYLISYTSFKGSFI